MEAKEDYVSPIVRDQWLDLIGNVSEHRDDWGAWSVACFVLGLLEEEARQQT